MGTIGIGIGHDNDFIVIRIVNLEIRTGTSAYGINHGIDFFVFNNIIHFGLSGIEYLTT